MNARIHPLTQQPINGKPRKELAKALKSWREQRAKYDAASQSDEFKNYWAAADSYDADSANSYEVRQRLIARSRYEVANNGYADGIASTYVGSVFQVARNTDPLVAPSIRCCSAFVCGMDVL